MAKPPSSHVTDSRLLGLHLQYQYPFYEDLLEGNKGALSLDRRSHACWYYLILAHRNLRIYAGGIENQQIAYDVGDTPPDWHESRLEEIARSVATIYALESPGEFLNDHWKARAWQTAQMLGVPIDPRVWQVAPGRLRLQ